MRACREAHRVPGIAGKMRRWPAARCCSSRRRCCTASAGGPTGSPTSRTWPAWPAIVRDLVEPRTLELDIDVDRAARRRCWRSSSSPSDRRRRAGRHLVLDQPALPRRAGRGPAGARAAARAAHRRRRSPRDGGARRLRRTRSATASCAATASRRCAGCASERPRRPARREVIAGGVFDQSNPSHIDWEHYGRPGAKARALWIGTSRGCAFKCQLLRRARARRAVLALRRPRPARHPRAAGRQPRAARHRLLRSALRRRTGAGSRRSSTGSSGAPCR